MKFGLIGEKLGHSFSKEIHGLLATYEYSLKELASEEFDVFMQEKNFEGINVTIPYKQKVIPYLDYISDEAKKIGAVNTVVNKDGKLYGYNTDFYGLKSLILKNNTDLSFKKVLILGSGGTSRTARAVAESLGASSVIVVGRTASSDVIDYDTAYSLHKDADAIINTTPVGMFPNAGSTPIDLSAFENLSSVTDVIYNPIRTKLVTEAIKREINSYGGLYMLVAQAAKASELFTGVEEDPLKTEAVYKSILNHKENIILTGMPSSGKSSIGQTLAKMLELPFYDTDALIEEEIKMTIYDFFKKYGEKAFRDKETEIIAQISSVNGAVIATGGGAILREESVDNLKSNGKVYFIDRPLSLLLPTDDRPLSSNENALTALFEKRYPIYKSTADISVVSDTTIEDACRKIISERSLI